MILPEKFLGKKTGGINFNPECTTSTHNTLRLPPKILPNHCFYFLLGPTIVPGEIENNVYPKFWRENKVSYGTRESGEWTELVTVIHLLFQYNINVGDFFLHF